jgi:hypothetical protein
VTYRGGQPSSGRRDLDGDGLFEVVESWSARGLDRMQVDLDHDGSAEYTVDFARRLWLWDQDQDGRADRTGPVSGAAPAPETLWPAIIAPVARPGERP